ncbi:GntR family transcriptional regulator [Streptomyces sp. B1866]|uniref:GntR family transcriptional regulator n=1 Tax=Streptomyces sp. B1866 TaxID=3075431 RepID=UPI00288F404C|nr:GntR family transcriptional regulator [Streptomyces sp. B1866]MDT3396143.1 GntR family transcriptional regulator [Streptomyces sp. B1866]
MATRSDPLYVQLADALREKIVSGAYPQGSKLPSERTLCEAHGASRNTVRLGLQRLVAEGLISPIHGRAYIVRRSDVLVYNSSRSEDHNRRVTAGVDAWVQDIREQGREPSQKITVSIEEAQPDIAKRLEIEPNALVVVRRRLRYVDEHPWSTEDSYYPHDIVRNTPVAEPADIPEGVIAYMASMGYGQVRYVDDVTALMPNPKQAEELAVEPGVPLLVRTRVGYTEERPVRVTVTSMPTDRNVLRYELGAREHNV